METWEWIVVAAVGAAGVLALAGLAWTLVRRRRRTRLRERFGGEYDRTARSAGEREAERRLTRVEQEHEGLEIRELPEPARSRYLDEWRHAESRFVSDPTDAVRVAERIVVRVLEDRGYPVNGDRDARTAHIAVDYPGVADRYRHAHELVAEAEESTEHLRQAMVDLRTVFEQVLARERATV